MFSWLGINVLVYTLRERENKIILPTTYNVIIEIYNYSNQEIVRQLLMEKMESQPSYAAPPYPYPQPPPSMPPPTRAVYTVVPNIAFGKESQHMTCPHCHADISTRIESEANTKTHIIALLLCAFACCCVVPCVYCMDTCLVQKHYCPACNSYLGESKN